jgi:hypothetical protein
LLDETDLTTLRNQAVTLRTMVVTDVHLGALSHDAANAWVL